MADIERIKQLCNEYTNLKYEDIKILEDLASHLQYISDLTENDIFIDALTKNGRDSIVLAWARPKSKSLYRKSVVGELAYSTNEPAVYHTSTTGEISRDIRGASQEGVPISQTVVPVTNSNGKVIGVLIREKDISKELEQEEQVEFLSHTAERLSSIFMYLSMTESTFEDWLGNGLFILNKQGKITYANKNALKIYKHHCGYNALGNDLSILIPDASSLPKLLSKLKEPLELKFQNKCYCLQGFPLISQGELSGCAVTVQDVTDLRKKEQELNIKSIIIREIHHRVKNNLQNIAALLRLQMRRSQSDFVKAEFAASINRIMAIALVHEVFACQTWDSIDLIELSERILDCVIEHSVGPDCKINSRVEGQRVQLGSQQAIPLALVINELISNSIKHGVGPRGYGEIIITINECDGLIYLSVSDNGPNPPDDAFLKFPKNHLGLQIVDSLVRENLGGNFLLKREDEFTRAVVSFPKCDLGE